MALWIQPAALAIVLIYVMAQLRVERSPWRFLTQLALISAAGFLAEESAIRWYGFYDYADTWCCKLGHLPVLVLLIWPVVIHSSGRLATDLATRSGGWGRVPLLTGVLVLTDAALIEPVAVHAGLWTWFEPGLFGVPPIGILGWAFFAAWCQVAIRLSKGRPLVLQLMLLPLTFVGTHLCLLAAWWGGMRWVSQPLPGPLVATVALVIGAGVVAWVLGRGVGRGLQRRDLLLRIPAALFFGVLLVTTWPGVSPLVAYFAAFTPPYIILTLQGAPDVRATKEE